jgi:hypothetical protein
MSDFRIVWIVEAQFKHPDTLKNEEKLDRIVALYRNLPDAQKPDCIKVETLGIGQSFFDYLRERNIPVSPL